MRQFVRGRFARALSMLLMVSMMVPSLWIPMASPAHAVGKSVKQIAFLPLPVTETLAADHDIPQDIGERIFQELRVLMAAQDDVEVSELLPNSTIMGRARTQLGGTVAKELDENYQRAADMTQTLEERMKAAGALVKPLNLDAVIFGQVDKYEHVKVTPKKSMIRVTAYKVIINDDEKIVAENITVIGKAGCVRVVKAPRNRMIAKPSVPRPPA